jgi:2-isopropylmalate synthase
VQSATRGKDAQGDSLVELEHSRQLYRGRGASTDTIEAATRAYLNAVNRIAAGAGQSLSERPDQV